MRSTAGVVSLLGVLIFLTTGCSTPQTSEANVPTKTSSGMVSNTTIRIPSESSGHNDGSIASMQLVKDTGQNPNIDIYQMFYWSSGYKVEAYVTVPKKSSGRLVLFVGCHGGSIIANSNMFNEPSPITLAFVAKSPANGVYFYPQYRGYADSSGTVSDMRQDAIDTKNGITALESFLGQTVDSLYLYGTSMGGTVALMLAGDPSYSSLVKYVIDISPFVGWETVEQWAIQNKNNSQLARDRILMGKQAYGDYSSNKEKYIENSPNIKNIDAPVLILQGTADQEVAWQSVQMFYREMKQDGKNVTLELIPGGTHGLQGKYQPQVKHDVTTWLKTINTVR